MMEDVRSKVGVSLFIGSVQFLIALTLAEILYPNYSLSANPLSDLGATEEKTTQSTPTHPS